jgi:hypothetical protein
VWPASFAIPYLLTAPLPPSVELALAPAAAPVDCRTPAPACFATARVVARNQSNRTLLVDELRVILSHTRSSLFTDPFDPPLPIPPFGEVTLPDLFAFHVEASYGISLAFHQPGERRGRHLMGQGASRSPAALRNVPGAACLRCDAGHEAQCGCRTRDGGQRCTEPSQCQGVCLFDRFEKIPEPPCPALARCGISAPMGFRVGHCSEFKTPIGCPDVLDARDSAERPIAVPAGRTRRCFDEAALIKPDATESSRRR